MGLSTSDFPPGETGKEGRGGIVCVYVCGGGAHVILRALNLLTDVRAAVCTLVARAYSWPAVYTVCSELPGDSQVHVGTLFSHASLWCPACVGGR